MSIYIVFNGNAWENAKVASLRLTVVIIIIIIIIIIHDYAKFCTNTFLSLCEVHCSNCECMGILFRDILIIKVIKTIC